MEMSKYPFQNQVVTFDFVQQDDGWWLSTAKHELGRSTDGEDWEFAAVDMQVLDKDRESAISTCWNSIGAILQQCNGNLFEYEHSKLSTKTNKLAEG